MSESHRAGFLEELTRLGISLPEVFPEGELTDAQVTEYFAGLQWSAETARAHLIAPRFVDGKNLGKALKGRVHSAGYLRKNPAALEALTQHGDAFAADYLQQIDTRHSPLSRRPLADPIEIPAVAFNGLREALAVYQQQLQAEGVHGGIDLLKEFLKSDSRPLERVAGRLAELAEHWSIQTARTFIVAARYLPEPLKGALIGEVYAKAYLEDDQQAIQALAENYNREAMETIDTTRRRIAGVISPERKKRSA